MSIFGESLYLRTVSIQSQSIIALKICCIAAFFRAAGQQDFELAIRLLHWKALLTRAFGYGTVFCVNSIPEEITKGILNIPDDYKRICIIPIGIPEEWPKTPEKKDVTEVVLYDKFE